MSLKNLHNLDRIINSYEAQLGVTQANQFDQLKGLLFYGWSESEKILMPKSFNHAIGLPRKNGITYPLFDYEKLVFDMLQQYKHVWIKKATGLGITEFMLRYMAWLCLKDNRLRGSQICIVTGPRIELAITLINRMKQLFTERDLMQFDTKEL